MQVSQEHPEKLCPSAKANHSNGKVPQTGCPILACQARELFVIVNPQ
jgi:hypothetical protein